MKKKLVITATAAFMSLAMATTALAAPIEKGNGDVDNNKVINSNDASKIHKASIAGDESFEDQGNFDGDWRTRDTHMSVLDAQAVLNYTLQPEKFSEKVGLRFYSKSSTAIDAMAPTFFTDSELDSSKVNWNGEYTDHEAVLATESNKTIDKAVSDIASNEGQGWTSDAIEQFSQYLGGIYFIGDHGTAGQKVCLTTEEGWTIFNHAMRAIIPVSREDIAINCPTRLDDSDPTIYADYNSLDAATKARVDAFNELKKYIVTGVAYKTNIDTNNPMVLADMYALWKKAYPSNELTDEMISITADRFAEIYTRRYDIDTKTQNGAGDNHINGNEPGKNSSFVQNIIDHKLYQYEVATLQDVRDTFGDQITISTTKRADEEEGDQVWSFTVEFYTRYVEK